MYNTTILNILPMLSSGGTPPASGPVVFTAAPTVMIYR